MLTFRHAALFVACLTAAGSALAQAPAMTRVPGEIVAATPTTLTVKHMSGETVEIMAPANTPVLAMKPLTRADIKTGTFVGIGAKKEADGKQTAMQVVVFPESARGTGEGHREWNRGADSTMTNANVDAVVDSKNGNDVKLSYKGGSQTITVPADAKVITWVPGTRADVMAGKKVVVNATMMDGKPTASRIMVEKDGALPPM